MAITTLAELKTAVEIAQAVRFRKPTTTTEGANTYHSYWGQGGRPEAGAAPPLFSSGATDYRHTNATLGALPMVNAASGKKLILAGAQLLCEGYTGLLILYDRLWACSGFSTATIDTQTIINASTYPVNRGAANGAGVEPWLEVYAAPGATGATWTVNFQDQVLGGVRSATYTHPANAETVGQMMPLIMAADSASVYYPVDFTCSLSSGTAGDIGITLLRRITELSIPVHIDTWFGFLETGLAKIENGACLALMRNCTVTQLGVSQGMLLLAES